ncbi:MAG: hypothetical protein HZA50_04425 [Planctomycetes bacterium]|nr:hypothetical protein [Planctomycetota bacterium]
MATRKIIRDAFARYAQVGSPAGVQLVRLTELQGNNIYVARPIEFDQDGQAVFIGQSTMAVINLAEPAGEDGKLDLSADAVAIDVEGRWVVMAGPADGEVFAVLVENDGGQTGGESSNCSFTYTVKDLDGNVMKKNAGGDDATGMTPEYARLSNIEYEPAGENSYAMACRDGGQLKLLACLQERPKSGTC